MARTQHYSVQNGRIDGIHVDAASAERWANACLDQQGQIARFTDGTPVDQWAFSSTEIYHLGDRVERAEIKAA